MADPRGLQRWLRLHGTREAAQRLGVSERTIRRWRRRPESALRYHRREVEYAGRSAAQLERRWVSREELELWSRHGRVTETQDLADRLLREMPRGTRRAPRPQRELVLPTGEVIKVTAGRSKEALADLLEAGDERVLRAMEELDTGSVYDVYDASWYH